MEKMTMGTMIERLEYLEAQHHRFKRTAFQLGFLSVVILAIVLMAGARPVPQEFSEIKTGRIVLQDKNKKTRILLDIDERDGNPAIVIYDSKDQKRVELGTRAELSWVMFWDQNGNKRVDLGTNDRFPNLIFLPPQQNSWVNSGSGRFPSW